MRLYFHPVITMTEGDDCEVLKSLTRLRLQHLLVAETICTWTLREEAETWTPSLVLLSLINSNTFVSKLTEDKGCERTLHNSHFSYYVDITAEQKADFPSTLNFLLPFLTHCWFTSLHLCLNFSLNTFLKTNIVKNGAANISVMRATSKGSRMNLFTNIENISTRWFPMCIPSPARRLHCANV